MQNEAEPLGWTLSYAFNKRSAVGCRELFARNNEFLCSFVWLLKERFKAVLQRHLWIHFNCEFEYQSFIWSRKTDLYNQHSNKALAEQLWCVSLKTLCFLCSAVVLSRFPSYRAFLEFSECHWSILALIQGCLKKSDGDCFFFKLDTCQSGGWLLSE